MSAGMGASRPCAVTSIASGPAPELFDLLRPPDAPAIAATCLDIDPEALAYCHDVAAEIGVTDWMTFLQENAVRLALGQHELALAPQDLIYTMGLVDYLDDGLVVALLSWMYDHVRPGGTAVLGNFDVGLPDRAFGDHVLEWELIYGSPEDLRRLIRSSRFGDVDVRVERDMDGVQLFAFAHRPV